MEINITEIDSANSMNPYENFNYNSYWESEKKPVENTKKKKVSFDDILLNMNLVVNEKGVLQLMGPQNNTNNYHVQTTTIPNSQEPIDPSVKHSYIYNKYFKDYTNNIQPQIEVKVPKTIEEYRQMVLEERIKAIENKKRIEEIKSTKLMFTAGPTIAPSNNLRNINASRNNLRKMSFY